MKGRHRAVSSLLKEIDLARCKEQWSKAVDLSDKCRKADKQYTLLHDIIDIEAKFHHFLKKHQQKDNDNESSKVYLYDRPLQVHLFLTPQKSDKSIQYFISTLERILQRNDGILSEGSNEEIYQQLQFAKILLARMHFELNQFEATLKLLQNLAIRVPTAATASKNDGQHYSLILLVQARTMKGICLSISPALSTAIDCRDNDTEALIAFKAGWAAIQSTEAVRFIQHYPTVFDWSEKCLYYACLLSLKLLTVDKDVASDSSTLDLLLAYEKLMSSYSNDSDSSSRVFRHWTITKLYVQYLLEGLKAGNNQQHDRSLLMKELQSNLVSHYQKLFERVIRRLPTAGDRQSISISACKLSVEAYDIFWNDPYLEQFRKRKLMDQALQFLYLGRAYTDYNCPIVLRLLFCTLIKLSSQSVSYMEETRLALLAYLEAIGISVNSTNDTILHQVKTILGKNTAETINDVLNTISLGVYFHGHLSNAMASNTMAQRSEDAAMSNNGHIAAKLAYIGQKLMLNNNEKIHKDMQRMYMSAQCLSPATLIPLSEEVGSSEFLNAKNLIRNLIFQYKQQKQQQQKHLLDRTSIGEVDVGWKSLYVYSLYYAMIDRNIHKAIELIKKSLAQEPDHVHSWHLLALLYTCPVLDTPYKASLAKSLEVIRVGIAKCLSSISSDNPLNSNAMSLQQIAETVMDMKMTEAVLIEKVEGPQQALASFQQIFSLYAQFSDLLKIEAVGEARSQYTETVSKRSNSVSSSVSAPTTTGGSVTGSDVSYAREGRYTSLSLSRASTWRQSSFSSTKSATVETSTLRLSISVGRSRSLSTTACARPSEVDMLENDESLFPLEQQHPRHPRHRRHHRLLKRRSSRRKQRQRSTSTSSVPLTPLSTENKQLMEDLQQPQRHTSTSFVPSEKNLADYNPSSSRRLDATVSLKRPMGISSSTSKSSSSIFSGISSNNSFYRRPSMKRAALQQLDDNEGLFHWRKVLVSLWLMVARAYAMACAEQNEPSAQQLYLKEACKALSEAEQIDPNEAEVWYCLGRLSLLRSSISEEKEEMKQVSSDAFSKAALLFHHDYSRFVLLSSTKDDLERFFVEMYREQQQRNSRASILQNADIWYQYAQVLGSSIENEEDKKLQMKSLMHALELHDTAPVRSFSSVLSLPRFLA